MFGIISLYLLFLSLHTGTGNSNTQTCTECPDVEHAPESGATYTCTTAADSRVSACAVGYFKTVGRSGDADLCTACTIITNEATGATYTCTSVSNSRVSACEGDHFKTIGSSGAADTCTTCTACARGQFDSGTQCDGKLILLFFCHPN